MVLEMSLNLIEVGWLMLAVVPMTLLQNNENGLVPQKLERIFDNIKSITDNGIKDDLLSHYFLRFVRFLSSNSLTS